MTSTSYPSHATDWRGLFIKHLVDALATQVELHLWAPPGEIPNSVINASFPHEAAWLQALVEQGGIAHLLRTRPWSRIATPFKLLWLLRQVYHRHPSMDLFHVNWLQNALPLWGTRQPALISVLGSDLALLKLPMMVTLLRQVFKQRRCILAPNAEWMTVELERQFGTVAQIRYIPFGIDAMWYQITRNWQQLPTKRWLVVSRLTRKKIGPLFEWGQDVFRGAHELHLLGPNQESLDIPPWVHYHGATHPQDLKENWFPYAVGLITLSQHDEGRPQVMLEAMAAGLPILASRLPAHNNLLKHQQTGWLTDSLSDFKAGIMQLTEPQYNEAISSQAKQWVQLNIGTWADCAQRYLTAYHWLLK